jgi:hypothetical protein
MGVVIRKYFFLYVASADAAHGGGADFGAVDPVAIGSCALCVGDDGQVDVVQGWTNAC